MANYALLVGGPFAGKVYECRGTTLSLAIFEPPYVTITREDILEGAEMNHLTYEQDSAFPSFDVPYGTMSIFTHGEWHPQDVLAELANNYRPIQRRV